MSKLTKTLLALAVTGLVLGFIFVSGLVNVEYVNALYVTLPLGAVFFGLFLISKMLDKEVAIHDEEQRSLLRAANAAEANTNESAPRNASADSSNELIPAKAH